MTATAEKINYFDDLARSSWRIWIVSFTGALGLNLILFLLMPHLLDQKAENTLIDTIVPRVNVIRMKRPDSQVRPKEEKPPPPEQKKVETSKPLPSQPARPKLALPFEINPRLPDSAATLKLPDLSSVPLMNADLSNFFSEGQLDAPLTVLARIPPIYPLRARNRGIEGWVKVSFMVNEKGRVEDISVLESSPKGIFEQSVIRCVGSWRFKPGTVEGMAVKAKAETIIRFELE